MRSEAAALYSNAVDYLRPENRPRDMILGAPVAERVEWAPEVVAVQFPVVLKGFPPGENDDRAAIFFIYNLPKKRSVFGTFGHPEWSTGAADVRWVKPLRYFVIGRDPSVYFVAEHFGAWEDVGTHAPGVRQPTLRGAQNERAGQPVGLPGPVSFCYKLLALRFAQYMSCMCPPPPGIAGSLLSSGRSVIMTSVVNIRPATLAAFCKAHRVTLVGSMIPASIRSTYSSF